MFGGFCATFVHPHDLSGRVAGYIPTRRTWCSAPISP